MKRRTQRTSALFFSSFIISTVCSSAPGCETGSDSAQKDDMWKKFSPKAQSVGQFTEASGIKEYLMQAPHPTFPFPGYPKTSLLSEVFCKGAYSPFIPQIHRSS